MDGENMFLTVHRLRKEKELFGIAIQLNGQLSARIQRPNVDQVDAQWGAVLRQVHGQLILHGTIGVASSGENIVGKVETTIQFKVRLEHHQKGTSWDACGEPGTAIVAGRALPGALTGIVHQVAWRASAIPARFVATLVDQHATAIGGRARVAVPGSGTLAVRWLDEKRGREEEKPQYRCSWDHHLTSSTRPQVRARVFA